MFIFMFTAYNTSQTQPNDSSVQYENISLVNGFVVLQLILILCTKDKR